MPSGYRPLWARSSRRARQAARTGAPRKVAAGGRGTFHVKPPCLPRARMSRRPPGRQVFTWNGPGFIVAVNAYAQPARLGAGTRSLALYRAGEALRALGGLRGRRERARVPSTAGSPSRPAFSMHARSRSSHRAPTELPCQSWGGEGLPIALRAGVGGQRRQDAGAQPPPSERSPGCAQRTSGDGAWAAPSRRQPSGHGVRGHSSPLKTRPLASFG